MFFRARQCQQPQRSCFTASAGPCLAGMVLRCAVYLVMYYTYSQPRAVVWQLYAVTCAIYYSCQGQAFLLSQVGNRAELPCRPRCAPSNSTAIV